MRKYTNQRQVETFLGRSLTKGEQEIFPQVSEYASKLIEDYTHRTFTDLDGDAPEAEERYFDGIGTNELFIDDFQTIEEIEVLDILGGTENTIEADHYTLYPQNSTTKNSVILKPSLSFSGIWPLGSQNIRVTAIWGSGETPSDVQMVAAKLAANFYNTINGRGSSDPTLKRESIEGYSYEILTSSEQSQATQSILNQLSNRRKILL